ncbi:MAG: hypothetical protein Pg6A_19850 [Termitinemataceae bacterium]|nr:MAG: hypothetical protein Pg6A_19850 [Termitinemataceae bacterium]
MIAVDIETKDPNLKTLGSGAIRKDGFITCVSLYDGRDTVSVLPDDPRLKDWLLTDEPKIFHNAIYDTDWLQNGYGLKINGPIEDTMTREALLNEYAKEYTLDACCKRRGVEGKNYTDTVDAWWKEQGLKGKAIENMDKIPFSIQAKYCEQDVKATYNLYVKQQKLIENEGLVEANQLEVDVMPATLEMRKNGMPIDIRLREEEITQFQSRVDTMLEALEKDYGITATILSSPMKLGKRLNELGIVSPILTPGGKQSFSANAFAQMHSRSIDADVLTAITDVRLVKTTLDRFLIKMFREHEWNGYIYPTLVPSLRDVGGTVTGRFACKNPNMQTLSAFEEKGAKELRSLIIPEPGYVMGSFDYKQVEYYTFGHFAVGPKAEEMREKLRAGVDFHTLSSELTGVNNRVAVKTFNFGILYGMGLKGMLENTTRGPRFLNEMTAMAAKAGKPLPIFASEIYEQFHTRMPFIKATTQFIKHEGAQKGYVRSLVGRKHRNPPPQINTCNNEWGIPYYKLISHKIQGSASEILKMAMIKTWKAGINNVLKFHLSIHDELLFSAPLTPEGREAVRELKDVMEHAVTLSVPLRTDPTMGPNWYDTTEEGYKAYLGESND